MLHSICLVKSVHQITSILTNLSRDFDILFYYCEVLVEFLMFFRQNLEAGSHSLVQGIIIVRWWLSDPLKLLLLQLRKIVTPAVGFLSEQSSNQGHHQRGTCGSHAERYEFNKMTYFTYDLFPFTDLYILGQCCEPPQEDPGVWC